MLRRRMVLYPTLFGLVALLGAVDAPIAAIAVAAAAAGLTMPPVSSVLRSIWPTVAGEDGAKTAYALDAALQEVIFVGGPLLVAVLAIIDPVAPVVGAAVLAAVGTFAFSRIPPVRAAGPRRSSTAPGSVPCRRSASGRSRSSASASASASVRSRSPSLRSPRRRATAPSQASPSQASRPAPSSAGSSPACGRRATSGGGSSSARSASPG